MRGFDCAGHVISLVPAHIGTRMVMKKMPFSPDPGGLIRNLRGGICFLGVPVFSGVSDSCWVCILLPTPDATDLPGGSGHLSWQLGLGLGNGMHGVCGAEVDSFSSERLSACH